MLRDATRRVSAGAPSLFAQAAGWGREPCVSSARGAVGSGTLVARTSSPPAAGAPAGARWFAKPVRRPTRKVKSGAAAWGEKDGKGKALAPIANAWTEVTCTETGKTYWFLPRLRDDDPRQRWNKSTNQTTGLGEPRPDTFRLAPINRGNSLTRPFDARGRPTTGLALGQMFIFGIGGALGITFVSVILRTATGAEAHDPEIRREHDTSLK